MCIPELPYNKRGYYYNWHIEDVGFSDKLTSLLQSYNMFYGLYRNMQYFTFNELKEAVNGDIYLIAEFNDKMAKLGFGWSAIGKKLRYKYRLVNSETYTQSYFEIDVYKFLKKIDSEHDRNKEPRLIETMTQNNEVKNELGKNEALDKLAKNLHLIKTLDKEFIVEYYESLCQMVMVSGLSNADKMELLNYIYSVKTQLNTSTLNI